LLLSWSPSQAPDDKTGFAVFPAQVLRSSISFSTPLFKAGLLQRPGLTTFRTCISAIGLLLALSPITRAEHLPIRTYTTADGLVDNRISRIVRDSRGFMWFCTEAGLSRFDGYAFTNYTVEQGLPDNEVNDLLETRDGVYWIATGTGLCRFNPRGLPTPGAAGSSASPGGQSQVDSQGNSQTRSGSGFQPMFTVYKLDADPKGQPIKTIYEDRAGTLWCGTWQGLYRIEQEGTWLNFVSVDIGIPASEPLPHIVKDIVEDRREILWATTDSGLCRRFPDGRTERFTTRNGLSSNLLLGLLEDSKGRLWVGDRLGGVGQIAGDPDAKGSIVARYYTVADGLPCTGVATLSETRDGRIWVGTDCGLSELTPDLRATANSIKAFMGPETLADARVWSITEDAYGNLWIGSAGGAIKLTRGGLTGYTEADGLGARDVVGIIETDSGELSVQTGSPRQAFTNRFDGHRFTAIRLELPEPGPAYDWHMLGPDNSGAWWLVTIHALWRYPDVKSVLGLSGRQPQSFYGSSKRPPASQSVSAYVDRRGDVWVSVGGEGKLLRWDRQTGRFQDYSESHGLPPIKEFVHSFCEDREGSLWMSFGESGVARFQNGGFRLFTPADGVPAGVVRMLFADREGRLWLAANKGGLGRIDEPSSSAPRFSSYTTASGLATNDVWCVVEGEPGELYAGTAHGLDRVDLSTGHIRHFTVADGLANDRVTVALRDHSGALWFGTETGLSRLVPEPDPASVPPPVYINRLRIGGDDQAISALGETAMAGLKLTPDQNHVQIDFGGIAFGTAENLRYQFKLEGADADWSQPTEQRTANYLELGPGAYRFQVRAVTADNVYSPRPATFEFTIPRPVWQRWWFVLIASLLAGSAIYGGYRLRLARLLELERVRTRIASDLHDDIGASLSRMALMTEVVKREVGSPAAAPPRLLTDIADTARGLVDSMSDIVWSTDPRRDDLNSVVQRVRAFASDVLEAKQIHWEFEAPAGLEKVKLGPDQRRHLFLILKEAVNNAARHSGAASAAIAITISSKALTAEIRDDGRGVACSKAADGLSRGGHGLENMRKRAMELGGTLDVVSEPGLGTRLTLSVPLKDRLL
jgi:signal transduction histidine kinase/ligand-binding sensor domain-containing protein